MPPLSVVCIISRKHWKAFFVFCSLQLKLLIFNSCDCSEWACFCKCILSSIHYKHTSKMTNAAQWAVEENAVVCCFKWWWSVLTALVIFQAVLEQEGVALEAILCTHKHWWVMYFYLFTLFQCLVGFFMHKVHHPGLNLKGEYVI